MEMPSKWDCVWVTVIIILISGICNDDGLHMHARTCKTSEMHNLWVNCESRLVSLLCMYLRWRAKLYWGLEKLIWTVLALHWAHTHSERRIHAASKSKNKFNTPHKRLFTLKTVLHVLTLLKKYVRLRSILCVLICFFLFLFFLVCVCVN